MINDVDSIDKEKGKMDPACVISDLVAGSQRAYSKYNLIPNKVANLTCDERHHRSFFREMYYGKTRTLSMHKYIVFYKPFIRHNKSSSPLFLNWLRCI